MIRIGGSATSAVGPIGSAFRLRGEFDGLARLNARPLRPGGGRSTGLLLAALLALMLGGIVLSLAASPPVASRLGLEPFYFVSRHVLYLIPALAVLLGDLVPAAALYAAARAHRVRR